MKCFHSPRRNCAFTLIEILVVIAIVMILAAILFPVFSSARNSAHKATCASNLKQLGVAMNLYANDYNQTYPFYGVPENYCAPWANRLFPYVRDEHVFECPSFETGEFVSGCRPSEPETRFGSYDMNLPNASYTVDDKGEAKYSFSEHGINLVRYTRPANTILLLDGDGHFVSPGYQEPAYSNTADLIHYGVDAHHDEGCNVAFADGHVKWLALDKLLPRGQWKLNGLD